jgi:hypothetical protein
MADIKQEYVEGKSDPVTQHSANSSEIAVGEIINVHTTFEEEALTLRKIDRL